MAILGISGRINSGKDTVGAIIQYLMSTERCEKGILGKQHVTLEEWLSLDNLYNTATTIASGWQVKKFAGKLKEVASILTGIPADQFEDQKFKDSYMSSSWSYSKQITEFDGDEGEDAYAFLPMTYRLFLQKLGTEAIRNGLHTNAWVNALFADYKDVKQSEDGLIHEKYGEHDITIVPNPILWREYYPHWIITDLRFPNEYEAIKSRGGLCIQVERGTQTAYYSDFPPESSPLAHARGGKELHPSETSLDSHKFDYVLDNSSDIESLVKEVEKMLRHFKLL